MIDSIFSYQWFNARPQSESPGFPQSEMFSRLYAMKRKNSLRVGIREVLL